MNIKCLIFGHNLEFVEMYETYLECQVCGLTWSSDRGLPIKLGVGEYKGLSKKTLQKFWHEYNFEDLVAAGNVNKLVEKLNDGENSFYDFYDQRRVIRALSRMKGMPVVEPLIEVIKRNDSESDIAIKAIGILGDKRAVEPLIAILATGTENPNLRPKIIEVLGQLGDSRAIAPLIEEVKNKNGSKEEAIVAMFQIGGDLKMAREPLLSFLTNRRMGRFGTPGELAFAILLILLC
jgi:HEAT repeat protein